MSAKKELEAFYCSFAEADEAETGSESHGLGMHQDRLPMLSP
jgi:hypothetical protein